MRKSGFLTLLVCILTVASGLAASAKAGKLAIRFKQGYDSNVFEIGDIPGADQVGAYYARVGARMKSASFGPAGSLKLVPAFDFKWFPSSSTADRMRGSLLFRFKNTIRERRKGTFKSKTTFSMSLANRYSRELFLRRSIREEIRVGTVAKDLPFGELPSLFQTDLEMAVASNPTRRSAITGNIFVKREDYTDSRNPDVPPYNKLDDVEFGVFLGVSRDITRHFMLEGGLKWRDRVYANRNARDRQGVSYPGEKRRYRFWDFNLSGAYERKGIANEAGVSYRYRADLFEGFYAYNQWMVEDRLSFRINKHVNMELDYSFGRRIYDNYAPSGSATENKYHDAGVVVAVKIADSALLRMGPIYERTVSNDPVLDYSHFVFFSEMRVSP